MNKSLTHLPENKRNEILEIVDIIKEEAAPEKIILFGSHAKGSWVEDEYTEEGIRYNYISDYDFLVVVDNNGKKEHQIISHIENRCEGYKNSVSPIVHSIDYINEGLSMGQYFFTDIINEGILLYDSGNYAFVKARELTPGEKKEKAKNYFEMWFPQGKEFLKLSELCYKDGSLKIGIFLLHQATESFYNTVLLVFTGYKPKTHNLRKLRNYSKHVSKELHNLFNTPPDNEQEYYLFDLLKRSYIDARYKQDYNISKEEYRRLVDKVTKMRDIVDRISKEKV